jgi:hypothetical protein
MIMPATGCTNEEQKVQSSKTLLGAQELQPKEANQGKQAH